MNNFFGEMPELAEGDGLENRYGLCPSRVRIPLSPPRKNESARVTARLRGEVPERPKGHDWKSCVA